MDVDALEKAMEAFAEKKQIKPAMRKVAHWVKKIKKEGRYETGIPQEMRAIKTIEQLGILNVEDRGLFVVAELNDKGKELDKDFFLKGYYIQG